jgi:hypothetical protein
MIPPLRKLRSDALEVAGSKQPEMVRRLSESEGGEEGLELDQAREELQASTDVTPLRPARDPAITRPR